MKKARVSGILLSLCMLFHGIGVVPAAALVCEDGSTGSACGIQSAGLSSASELEERTTLTSPNGFKYPSYIYLGEMVDITCPRSIDADYVCSVSDESIITIALESHSGSSKIIKVFSYEPGTADLIIETCDYTETITLTVVSERTVPSEDSRQLLTSEHGFIYPNFLYLYEKYEIQRPDETQMQYSVKTSNGCVSINGCSIGGIRLIEGESLYLYTRNNPGECTISLSYMDSSGRTVEDTFEITVVNGYKDGWVTGDMNLDGKVELSDYVLLSQNFREYPNSSFSPFQQKIADIDHDGKTSARDVYLYNLYRIGYIGSINDCSSYAMETKEGVLESYSTRFIVKHEDENGNMQQTAKCTNPGDLFYVHPGDKITWEITLEVPDDLSFLLFFNRPAPSGSQINSIQSSINSIRASKHGDIETGFEDYSALVMYASYYIFEIQLDVQISEHSTGECEIIVPNVCCYGIDVKSPTSYILMENQDITARIAVVSDDYILENGQIVGQITTTTTTTTTTETTTTTSLTTTTEALPEPDRSAFVWGKDNWSFANRQTSFTQSKYQIGQDYLAALRSNLSNTEWYHAQQFLKQDWSGSCYGMAALAWLLPISDFPYDEWTPNAEKLYDLDIPVNNSDIESLINYYHLLQLKAPVQDQYRAIPFQSNQENISAIIRAVQTSGAAVIGYQKSNWGGHAVLAYDISYGSWTIDDVTYQGRIEVFDPNYAQSYEADACIYFNTSTYNWTVPIYKTYRVNSASGAVFNMISSDADLLNNGGYLFNQGQEYHMNSASLQIKDASDSYEIGKVKYEANGFYVNQATGDNDILSADFYYANGTSSAESGYVLKDTSSAYKVYQETPSKMDLCYESENYILSGEVAAGHKMIFDPNGTVLIEGEASNYSMDLVSNASKCITDWYSINVQGENADDIMLSVAENGYVLSGSNLQNVGILATNDANSADFQFSTAYKSALIYEIDVNTIGVSVDTDNDGVYETPVENQLIALSTTTTTETTTTTTTSETTTTATSEDTTTTETILKHITSDEDICAWAVNDYQAKTGAAGILAEITSVDEEKYEITLTDESGNVVDVYIVDPTTGIGTNSADETVNLPQTGNNTTTGWLTLIAAFLLIGLGWYAVRSSNVVRRKTDEI